MPSPFLVFLLPMGAHLDEPCQSSPLPRFWSWAAASCTGVYYSIVKTRLWNRIVPWRFCLVFLHPETQLLNEISIDVQECIDDKKKPLCQVPVPEESAKQGPFAPPQRVSPLEIHWCSLCQCLNPPSSAVLSFQSFLLSAHCWPGPPNTTTPPASSGAQRPNWLPVLLSCGEAGSTSLFSPSRSHHSDLAYLRLNILICTFHPPKINRPSTTALLPLPRPTEPPITLRQRAAALPVVLVFGAPPKANLLDAFGRPTPSTLFSLKTSHCRFRLLFSGLDLLETRRQSSQPLGRPFLPPRSPRFSLFYFLPPAVAMGIGYKWILSFCMLVVPIAITLGVLFPLQNAHRSGGNAGSVLGGGGVGTGPGSGGAPKPKNNNVELATACTQFADLGNPQRYYWDKSQQQYTFNPNQWGLTSGAKSGMCMDVLFNNNGTYAKPELAPPFQVTWSYTPAPQGQNNVHAFANIKLEKIFPKKFSTIKKLFVDFEWKYVTGNDNSTASETATLAAGTTVNTNVAIDMFADTNSDTSKNNEKAAFEIMIWFAAIGPSAHVIGQDTTSVVTTLPLQDTTTNAQVLFDLYADKHPTTSQFVLTWKAKTITEKFHGDVYPLIEYILTAGNSSYPSSEAYLGSFGMGTEAYDSPSNVTFFCPDFAVQVE
ncbi:Concanavalin A-like lectin glucanase [Cordyceps militaris]|uniref:Concanavalin A-like lectin glucanase n=1 Tax=Cordyceps militaris TaxID=73501 RepID=A0A2H4S681_CORMI|nr:Concanavalin A-like lectin glucanase [Cordyceps militaris]